MSAGGFEYDVGTCRALGALAQRASAEDQDLELPGVCWLEHINIVVGERALAEEFYFKALGCTLDANGRDANIGQQQFHINNGGTEDGDVPQVVGGCIGLAMPALDSLRARLAATEAAGKLSETRFAWQDCGDFVKAICPWGNTFLVWDSDLASATSAGPAAGTPQLPVMVKAHVGYDDGMAVRKGPSGTDGAGIRFVEFRCADAEKVAQFYKGVFSSPVLTDGDRAAVCVGPSVHLLFSTAPVTPAEQALHAGVHICVYITNFRQAYETLKARGVIWTNPRFMHLDTCDTYEDAARSRQFRFKAVVDLNTGDELLELEHETRTIRHFQYMKHVAWEASL
eukprot:COSAG02_NODE_1142_length_14267_cov_4.941700_7_plen_340_part_00